MTKTANLWQRLVQFSFLRQEVPHEVVKLWKVDGREHVIGLVELYACVVALNEWKEAIAGQRVLLFIDSYGAQDCLVKGSASINT